MRIVIDEAQEALDRAVQVKGHLYGFYRNGYYEFRQTGSNIYHGFKVDELTDEVKKLVRESIQH